MFSSDLLVTGLKLYHMTWSLQCVIISRQSDFLQAFWTLSAVINKIWEPSDFWEFLYFILYLNPETILGIRVEFILSNGLYTDSNWEKIW